MRPSDFDQHKKTLKAIEGIEGERLLAEILHMSELTLEEMGELALLFFQTEKYALAAMVFAKWTEHDPQNPEPWTNLGYTQLKLKKFEQARALTEHALALDKNYFSALTNLCDIYLQLGLHEQQLLVANQSVTIQPQSFIAHNNLGTALWHNGQVVQAHSAFAESLRINPQYFEARLNLAKLMSDAGDHLSATGELELLLSSAHLSLHEKEVVEFYLSFEYLYAGKRHQGWSLYERGFSPNVSSLLARKPVRSFLVTRWQGEPLSRQQKLLIWREQGIGDELRFLALLQLLTVDQSQWIIETDARLVNILQRAYPKAEVRVEPEVAQEYLPLTDGYHIPVGSLAQLLLPATGPLPKLSGYLTSSTSQKDRFFERLVAYQDRVKIGLCWRSHKTNAVRNKKYTVLQDWKPLLSLPNVVFVSLQYGEAEQEILAVEKELDISILRWSDVNLKDDLEAVLGIMHQLDVVVSTSTAVVPLAGALGKSTVFLGHSSWIFMGETQNYPWHASVKPVLVPPSQPVASGIQSVINQLNLKF